MASQNPSPVAPLATPLLIEDVVCSCIRAASAPMAASSALAAVYLEWCGQLSSALLAGWNSQLDAARPSDWRGSHSMFEVGFLLGKCGEERPFPSD